MAVETVNPRSRRSVSVLRRTPRVALATDATHAEQLPLELAVMVQPGLAGDLSFLRKERIPANADALIFWMAGETILTGTFSEIRRDLHYAGRCAWVPVHRPGLPLMDLVSVEPRWQVASHQPHSWLATNVRVQSTGLGSTALLEALEGNRNPWAALTMALLEEKQTPGRGLELLVRLWKNMALPPVFRALVLRNLIVVLQMHKLEDKARDLLKLGHDAFPGYAELYYLDGVMAFQNGDATEAIKQLKKATSHVERGYIGSGGESSYRARWLLGTAVERETGDDKVALVEFFAGLIEQPVFRPAVESLLKLNVFKEVVIGFETELCRVVRRENYPLQPVFDFLLCHRRYAMLRQLLDTQTLADEERAEMLAQIEREEAPFHPTPAKADDKPGVMLVGSFLVQSSLARINREVGRTLMDASDVDVTLEQFGFSAGKFGNIANEELFTRGMRRRLQRLDLTIRHHWPPNFTRPEVGKLAIVLPWEYGAVPQFWVSSMEKNVDELWVPSRFVRDVMVRAGVSGDRVQVIPNGVDTNVFNTVGAAKRPTTARQFVFLFVGGAIQRKGIDLLLEAYQEAFLPGEDVTLIIQDSGSQTFYANQNYLDRIRAYSVNPRRPHVILQLGGGIADTELAALYRGCDAFVLPYRGEGFGMPIAEAAACGKPVIATGAGPAMEFLSPDCAYFVPAKEVPTGQEMKDFGAMSGELTWFQPDVLALADTMRRVYENRREAAQRGAAASKRVRAELAWPRILSLYMRRVRSLCGVSQAEPVAELALR